MTRKMKRLRVALLGLTFILAVILTSCQNLPYLTAKIDGENFKALFISAIRGQIPDVGTGFMIIASNSVDLDTSSYIAILVRGDSPGEYRVDVELVNGVYQCAAIYYKNGRNDSNNVFFATDGYVKLTQVDLNNNKIAGEFSFTLYDKKNNPVKITDGKFANIIFVNLEDNLPDVDQFNYQNDTLSSK